MNKIINKKIVSIVIAITFVFLAGAISYAAPIVEDFQKSSALNEPIHFTAADFLDHYQDAAELISVRFPELPSVDIGVLKLGDTDEIAAYQEIVRDDLDKITFFPKTDYSGTSTLLWQAYNGTDYSPSASIDMTIGNIVEPSPSPSPSPSISPSPSPSTEPTFPYIDMEGHWANPYAVELALKNILRGEQIGGNFYFEPSKVLNRGDFVLLLNAALGITTSTPNNVDFDFIDKDQMPDWLYRQGKIAYEAGVIKGVGENVGISFDPYGPLTRVEAVTMLNNVIEPINPSARLTSLDFADAGIIPDWGIDPIGKLVAKGLVQGYPDNTFRPFDPILRESAATLISGMLRNLPQAKTLQRIMMNNIESGI